MESLTITKSPVEIAVVTNNLDIDHDTAPPEEEAPSAFELTKILRWSGGLVLIAAAVVFLYQGVYSFSPIVRHWIMLGLCCLLGILGMITGTILKDVKGARTFLGFAACTFPALASQLGAMLFSIFGQPPSGMPQPLVFSMVHNSMVFGITALTLAVVIPVSYLSFRILARSQATLLTGLFTAANLCILLPVRSGIWVSAILTLVACTLFFIDNLKLRTDFRLESFEGRAARLMLTTPLLIMIGRSLFYPMNYTYYGYVLLLFGAYLAFHLGRLIKKRLFKNICQVFGQIIMAMGWLICLLENFDWQVPVNGMVVYMSLVPLALLLAAQVFVAKNKASSNYLKLSGLVGLISVVLAHLVGANALISTLGIIIALATMIMGALTADRTTLTWGILAGCTGLGSLGLQIFQQNTSYAWVALAFIGITTMFCASVIETKSNWLYLRGTSLWGRLTN